jgi:hypothetical protein
MTITTNAKKKSQNINPDIAINVQKKSPNDSNIFFLLWWTLAHPVEPRYKNKKNPKQTARQQQSNQQNI